MMDDYCHGLPNFIPFAKTPHHKSLFDVFQAKCDLADVDPKWFEETENDFSLMLQNKIDSSESCPQDANTSPPEKENASPVRVQSEFCQNFSPICRDPLSPNVFTPSHFYDSPSHIARVSCSTPRSLSACLGADVSSESQVWTISMETPVREFHKDVLNQNEDLTNLSTEVQSTCHHSETDGIRGELNYTKNNTSVSVFGESTTKLEKSKDGSLSLQNEENHSLELLNSTTLKTGIERSSDFLDFLLATPPSKRSIRETPKKSKKVCFDELNLKSLRKPEGSLSHDVANKPSDKKVEDSNDKAVANTTNSKNKLRKMLYPSARKTLHSLPTTVFNLKESSDGIIMENDMKNEIKPSMSDKISHSFDDSQAFDSTLMNQVFEATESAYAYLSACKGDGFSQALQNIRETPTKKNFEKCEHEAESVKISPKCDTVFTTGTGNKIEVSDVSLNKANKIFEMEFNDELEKVNTREDDNFSQALQNVQDSPAKKDFKKSDNNSELAKISPCCGAFFSTGGGKKIEVSDMSLKKANKIFEVEFNDELEQMNSSTIPDMKSLNTRDLNNHGSEPNFGFSTAGGKQIKFSNQALKQSEDIFEGIYDKKCQVAHTHDTEMAKTFDGDCFEEQLSAQNSKFSFSTATGKAVNISRKLIEKSQKIFECIDEDNSNADLICVKKRINSSNETQKWNTGFYGQENRVDVNHGMKMTETLDRVNLDCSEAQSDVQNSKFAFSTASGKVVNVSEKSLEKSLKIFESEDIIESNALGSKFRSSNFDEKSVKLSKETWKQGEVSVEAKATEIFDEDCIKEQASIRNSKFSFATASGKAVGVSEKSLEKSKKIVEFVGQSDSGTLNCKIGSLDSMFCTAGGKNVSVSKEALTATNKLFNDLNEDESESGNFSSIFSTANGKRISISDEALQKVQSFFNEDKKNEDPIDPIDTQVVPAPVQIGSMFATASGREVSVSKQTMMQVKSLFNEEIDIGTKNDDVNVLNPALVLSRSAKLPQESNVKFPMENLKLKPVISGPSEHLIDRGKRCFDPYLSSPDHELDRLLSNQYSSRHALESGESPPPKKSCDGVEVNFKKPKIEKYVKAREKQLKEIKRLGASAVKPNPGKYMQKYGEKKLKLRDIVCSATPRGTSFNELQKFLVTKEIAEINPESASCYKFKFSSTFEGKNEYIENGMYLIGDGALLVLSDENDAGKEEFYSAFLTLEGVDGKLINEEWFYNHYKWIIWKLASIENKYPGLFNDGCLTPDNLMYQIKYRYDREIDNCHRSSMKKILERDDVSIRRMVLCVSNVIADTIDVKATLESEKYHSGEEMKSTTVYSLELTDGWYPLRTITDDFLSEMIRNKRLKVGQKIMVHGAELVGSDEACSPLDAPSSVRLKISANSTRRCRWDVKLGFYPDPRPFPISLKSVVQNGGNVACVYVIVTRVYPYLFMEKFPDNTTVFRVRKAEEVESMKHECIKQEYLEKIIARIQSEHQEVKEKEKKKRRSLVFTRAEVKNLKSEEDIALAIDTCSDPESFVKYLDEDQIKLLQDHYKICEEKEIASINSKIEIALQEHNTNKNFVLKRSVSSLLRVRVVGCHSSDLHKRTHCVLNIWNPSGDLEELLQEGKAVKVYNVYPSTARRKRRHKDEICGLVANRMTRYEPLEVNPQVLDDFHSERQISCISDLIQEPQIMQYDEVDVVFMIVDIITTSVVSQTIYISDCELSIAALKFPGGPRVCGAEDFIHQGAILCASNLHVEPYKMHNGQIPCVVASDMSSFTTNPRRQHYMDAIKKLTELSAQLDIAAKCREKWSFLSASHLFTPKRNHNTSLPISPYNTSYNVIPKVKTMSVDRTHVKMSKLGSYGCAPTLPPINSPVLDLNRRKFKPPLFTPPAVHRHVHTSKFQVKDGRSFSKRESTAMDTD